MSVVFIRRTDSCRFSCVRDRGRNSAPLLYNKTFHLPTWMALPSANKTENYTRAKRVKCGICPGRFLDGHSAFKYYKIYDRIAECLRGSLFH